MLRNIYAKIVVGIRSFLCPAHECGRDI